jgi:hypothetical protein
VSGMIEPCPDFVVCPICGQNARNASYTKGERSNPCFCECPRGHKLRLTNQPGYSSSPTYMEGSN